MSCRSYLMEKEREFFHLTGDGGSGGFLIKDSKFVHIRDVFPIGASRNKFNRDIAKVPKDKKIAAHKCDVHNPKCHLVEHYCGFICYLHVLLEEEGIEEKSVVAAEEPTAADDEDDDDIVEDIDSDAEREESSHLDLDAIRNELPAKGEVYTDAFEIVLVPLLPSFRIDGKNYVLLTDIQTLFNIRQDYALAILAQNLEEDAQFLDAEDDKYILMDSNVRDSEFCSNSRALETIMKDALNGESANPIGQQMLEI